MKKLICCACLLVPFLYGWAQPLRGLVVDARSRQPVAGATVETGSGFITSSNEQGYFELPAWTNGAPTLTISSVGYKKLTTAASPSAAQTVFALEPWNLMMQPVEVRALRASARAPFAKTNISKREIEGINLGQDLPFLISQTPSVVVNSDAGNGIGYTGIRIRGTDATRINMTINGIPYNDAESQGLFFVNLPDLASSVQSIQIQRGVGTSTNGAGAFGATMNFSTNEVLPEAYGEIHAAAGSFNTWKQTVKAGTGLLNEHFTLDARLSRITSDGYVDRASSNLRSFYLSGAYLSKKSSLRLNVFSGKEKTYQAWYGISETDLKQNRRVNYAGTERPGSPYENETDNYQQDHYQLFFNHQLRPQLDLQTAVYLTEGKGYYEQYRASELFARYRLPEVIVAGDTLKETDLIRQLWLSNRLWGQTFSLQYKKTGTQLTFGGGWNRYEGQHFGEIIWAQTGIPNRYRWYDHEALKTDVNLYAKYQVNLRPNLSFFADLQYRTVRYSIDGFRDNPGLRVNQRYQFTNPKLGFTYTRNHTQWYLSYALAQKEPNRDDFEAGIRQTPQPELLHDFEAGVQQHAAEKGWDIGLYYMRYRNQLVLTGRINDVGAYTRTNIPDSYRTGLELQGYLHPKSWIKISGNLTLSRNRILNFTEYFDDYDQGGQKSIRHGNTALAFSPHLTGFGQVEFIPFRAWHIFLKGRYVSRQYLDNTANTIRSLEGYYVQDLNMEYALKGKRFREIRLMGQLSNLFHKLYAANGYTYSFWYEGKVNTENYYYPMAGLQALLGVNVKF